MKEALNHIKQERFTGSETILSDGNPVHPEASMLNFWKWYASGILTNTIRGGLAEYIVALAVQDVRVFNDIQEVWDSYDLCMLDEINSDEIKIEVKASGYIQSWYQKNGESTPKFGIGRKEVYFSDTATYSPDKIRAADIYVFCLYKPRDTISVEMLNPLEVSQWDFYILPTAILEREKPDESQISLRQLEQLGPRKVPFDQIRSTICEMLSQSDSTTAT